MNSARETRRHAVRKIISRKRTMRVTSPGLLSNFRLENNTLPKYMNTSSWATSIINPARKEVSDPVMFPANFRMRTTIREKARIAKCDKAFF
jgi:hypothetical protein